MISLVLVTHSVMVAEVFHRVFNSELKVRTLKSVCCLMLKAVPPVIAVEVTVVLSVAYLPEFFGLHVIHMTVRTILSVQILILMIFVISKMWTGYVMIVCNLRESSLYSNLCNGCTVQQLIFFPDYFSCK